MAVSNHRITAPDTVHHLVSRMAHRVYLMEESQRGDFLEVVRRVTEFSGLTLVGWCVMTNHFHLLVYLPVPEVPDEAEVVRRFGVLKGPSAAAALAARLAFLREKGGASEVEDELNRIRRRMYRVDEYMRMIKQWFTEEYNARTGHKGTMWESAYHDTPVPKDRDDLRNVLAYQHLNPIRAGLTDRFDDYAWSSFTAFRRGDAMALRGMRFAYGDAMTEAEIAEQHTRVMEKVLEGVKLERARKIVRLRMAGFAAPCDALTNEAMVAEAAEQMRVTQEAIATLHEERESSEAKVPARTVGERQIAELLKAEGPKTVPEIARRLNLAERTARRYLGYLKAAGAVAQEHRFAPWRSV